MDLKTTNRRSTARGTRKNIMTTDRPKSGVPSHEIPDELKQKPEKTIEKVENRAIPTSATWRRDNRRVSEERIEILPSNTISFGYLRIGTIYATCISLKNHGTDLVKFSIQKPDSSFISTECKNMTVSSYLDMNSNR